ncbi:DUF3566 domain-containing protein [Candidatus Eisenbacteria bacterium]|uniref:DUF3566 domain-containing protein n=1 Tax=Eiseniibacteriota bacterium TaxID=2212470 RepID=A0ABV6YIL5_UNCEI
MRKPSWRRSSHSLGPVNLGTALVFLALIGMPLIFAVVGAILGLIEATLYNLFARWSGGVEINIVREV